MSLAIPPAYSPSVLFLLNAEPDEFVDHDVGNHYGTIRWIYSSEDSDA